MSRDPLLRAWIGLLVLSAASTLIAVVVPVAAPGLMLKLSGAAILALAWFKARLILAQYLGLAAAPFWRRGFEITLVLYTVLLLALHLAGGAAG